MSFRLWNLIDIDHKLFLILPKEWEREILKFMDLRKLHHLWLANKQSNITIVTSGSIGSQRPKPNSILYNDTSCYASGFLKETILFHTSHENAHTSKILWPRCTMVKHMFKKTYLCHIAMSNVQLLILKPIFFCSHGFFKVDHNTREQHG